MNLEHPIRVETMPSVPIAGDASVSRPPGRLATDSALSTTVQTPLIDIHEGPDGLVLEADLPGVRQDDVAIQLEDNVLTLTAKVASVGGEARFIHQEYRHADFQRSFILSDEVDRERISAELKLGVLRLTLPKSERARTRRIEIKSS